VRVCPTCDKAVHNLSAIRREEAERVVAASVNSLCVCYDRDARGNILTVDYAVPPPHSGWRTRRWVGGATAIALLGAACQAFMLRPRPPVVRVMGACPPIWPCLRQRMVRQCRLARKRAVQANVKPINHATTTFSFGRHKLSPFRATWRNGWREICGAT
jgi:hypothetical protein